MPRTWGALWLRQMSSISRCAIEFLARGQVREMRPDGCQCEDMTPFLKSGVCQHKQLAKTKHLPRITAHVKILVSAIEQNDFSRKD